MPKSYKQLVQHIRRKLKTNWDHVTILSGPEGVGKSTFGLRFARHTDPDFDGTQAVFEHRDLLDMIQVMPPGRSILFDEAVQGAYSRNAMTKENKTLNKALMIARARCLHLILCIPSIWDLDSYIRDHRAKLWIEVTHRGRATVYEANPKRWERGVYWNNIIDPLRFGQLTGPTWDVYQARKMTYITHHLAEANGKPDPQTPHSTVPPLLEEAEVALRAHAAQAITHGWTTIPKIMNGCKVGRSRARQIRSMVHERGGGTPDPNTENSFAEAPG